MKRGVFTIVILASILLVSISFVSANIFTGFWDKLTGKATTSDTFSNLCGNGIKDSGEICDYMTNDSINNPYGNQCSSDCWVNGAPPYWKGCRGSGAHVCVDAPNVTSQYFVDHPNCIPATTCEGLFYNCNGIVCPAPETTNSPATSICNDSDNGLNYYVKGQVNYPGITDLINNGFDFCVTPTFPGYSYPKWEIGDLVEYVCRPYDWSDNSSFCDVPGGCVDYESYKCLYGCSDGKCNSVPNNTETNCNDSDGGANYYVKGTMKGILSDSDGTRFDEWTDYCNDFGLLDEFSCGNGTSGGLAFGSQGWNDLYSCPYGCSDGKCNPAPTNNTNITIKPTTKKECNILEMDEKICPYQDVDYTIRRFVQCNITVIYNNITENFNINPLSQVTLQNGIIIRNSMTDCGTFLNLTILNTETYEKYNGSPIPVQTNNSNLTSCDGCKTDRCYPFGYRKDGAYCSVETLTFVSQKQIDESCDNNFECGSNVCINSQCISASLIQKILNWFKNLFGA